MVNVKSIACTLVAATFAAQASAILLRKDYDGVGTSNYNRYLNLANQARFDTVGNIQLHTPSGSPGATNFAFSNNCTGTLISANVILTAAHCFDGGVGKVNSFVSQPSLSAMAIQAGTQVFFSGGGNLAVGETYNAKSIDYAVQIDRLSIYPSYTFNSGTSIGFGGDLALLRVYGAPWIGSLPTNYLPLNTGVSEPFPSPAFGITVGYGLTGNGRDGAVGANLAVEKRAGLTIVEFDFLHPQTLVSTFRSPGTYAASLLPSNLLQAAPARGDSGGPLILNVGGVDTIAGIVQGGGDFYGDKNWWTRISSFSDWIKSESLLLGSAPISTIPGTSKENPLLPNFVRDISTTIKEKSFTFLGGVSGLPVFLDPQASDQIDIYVDSGPRIASVFLPLGFGSPSLWLGSQDGDFAFSGLKLQGGEWFVFSESVERFRLKGITGEEKDLALGFEFAEVGKVDLRWQSITAVPEPQSWALFIGGLMLVVAISRKVAVPMQRRKV